MIVAAADTAILADTVRLFDKFAGAANSAAVAADTGKATGVELEIEQNEECQGCKALGTEGKKTENTVRQHTLVVKRELC